MKHGKKYNEAAKQVDRTVQYEPIEAIGLAKKRQLQNLTKRSKSTSGQGVTDVMRSSRFVVPLYCRMVPVRK